MNSPIKNEMRLHFTNEAPRIGSGWRKVIITKDKSKVRIKDPQTGAAHSFSPKRWDELGIEKHTAEYLLRNSVDAARKTDSDVAPAPVKPVRMQRPVNAAPVVDAAPAIVVAAKPEAAALSKEDTAKLAAALIASSDVAVTKGPTVVAKGAKVQKSTNAAKVAASSKRAEAAAKATAATPASTSTAAQALKAMATKSAPAKLPSVDALKAAVRKAADDKATAKAAKAAAKQPKVRKPSALHAAKLLLISKPSMSADDIVAAIAAKANGLKITRVTASTVRSDFLHSCRALKEAGYLKDLDI